MNIKQLTKTAAYAAPLLLLITATTSYADEIFVMQKQNTEFAIDGDRGAQQGLQIYLWDTNQSNVNQQWVEKNVDSDYSSYRKQDTDLCLDGGRGGENLQAVTLETCSDSNQNQHWQKVATSNGTFRMEKRGTNFSIDGNRGGENEQEIYLWESNSRNVNQQWQFFSQGETVSNTPVQPIENTIVLQKQNTGFSIDGNGGAREGQQVYLFASDSTNVNQQWVETSINGGYYAYRKQDTDLCLDGGDGGENRQAVTIESCSNNNENQHWSKVTLSNGSYRLEKRDTAYSIDGNRGGANLQEVYLWRSDDNNVNQQWSVSDHDVVPTDSRPNSTISSLSHLRSAIERSNQTIVMQPGRYNLASLPSGSRNLRITGSNNTVDLTGVYIKVPVGSTANRESYFSIDGSGNTLIGGEFEDTYNNGLTFVTDFVAYNEDRTTLASGIRGEAVMIINGPNNTVDGLKLTVRGSFPYGYGSLFGINQVNSFGLSKRCGLLVRTPNNIINNVEVQMRSFCHGIYMQQDADNTTILNTLVEGRVRESNDMLAEGRGSLPDLANNQDVDGNEILPDEAHSLSEDGIRAYTGTGSVRVENSTVRNMRGGFRLYLGGDATVINSTGVDNGNTNFNLPANATVINSSGNFTNGPLNDHRLGRSRQNIEMTILPSPNAVGRHNITDIQGNNHDIVFHRAPGPVDSRETRAIVVQGNNSTIRNETEYRIILESGTRGNTVISAGDVTDNGNNSVRSIELER